LNKVIITLKGKASLVFKLFDLFCQQKGDIRIEELGREK